MLDGALYFLPYLSAVLCRHGYEVCVGKLEGYVIDFIATRQEEKIYVQVAKVIVNERTREREYGRLLEIGDNYPIKTGPYPAYLLGAAIIFNQTHTYQKTEALHFHNERKK